MRVQSEIGLLQKVPLFAGIDPVQLQVLVFSAERVEIPANDTLFTTGSPVGAGHLVLAGEGEVLKPHSGEEAAEPDPVARVEAGAFMGELSMIADLPASVTVRASTPMRLLRISHPHFLRVCGEFPDIGTKVLETLTRRLDASLADFRRVQGQLDSARPFSRS
jgi:CRP-like cAMP-binding protein